MLTARVIPCLDCRDGRVVKGIQFQGLRDAGDPVERSLVYQDQGADELVLLDVSATTQGRNHQFETVRAVRAELGIPLTVGGGVREVADAERLLEAGADKVSMNTAAVRRPELLDEMAVRFGNQCTILAIDARRSPTVDGWDVVVRSGEENTRLDAIEWAKEAVQRGAGEILLTSWDRDGLARGTIWTSSTQCRRRSRYRSLRRVERLHLSIWLTQFKGGRRSVSASIFHDGDYVVEDVKKVMRAAGVEVRL